MLRLIRLGANSVTFAAHATQDSRYVLVPVIESASRITGWRVYDAQAGILLVPNPSRPMGPGNGVFTQLHEARNWLESEVLNGAQPG